MGPKVKAPAGTKAKAKAAAKEETKKDKVVKQAKKGKGTTSYISLLFLEFRIFWSFVFECLMCGLLTVEAHLTEIDTKSLTLHYLYHLATFGL